MKQKLHKTIFLALSCLIACIDSNEPEPLRAPGLRAPAIPGIVMTDALGNVYGRYGNPDEPGPLMGNGPDTLQHGTTPRVFDVSAAYPMPSNRSFNVQYDISWPSIVSIWIVRGTYTGNNSSLSFGNATLSTPGGIAVKTITRDELKNPGRYTFQWDGTSSDNGQYVPLGFYRVYVSSDQFLLWRDVFIFDTCKDIPIDMDTRGFCN
ncbi:hypothetical protein JNM05_13515 [bacterium]|nr:hypothetical protein [bacterium]